MKPPTLALIAALTCGSAMSQAALVSHWKFDELSGTTAADSAGVFNGTLSGGAAFAAGGISGNAVSLAEISNSLVNMGNSFPAFGSGDFSIMSWVKTTTTDTDTILLGKHSAGSANGYFLGVNTNGIYGASNKGWFSASSTTIGNSAISSTTVNDGAWHQIVGVYKAGGTADIYVDGAPVESSNPAPLIGVTTSAFLIGGVVNGVPIATYTGLVDDVQVYSNALSDSDVQYLFENPGQSVPEPGSLVMLTGVGLLFLGARRRALMPS